MRAVDIIRHKRDGGTLDRDEIDFFVHGVTARQLPDYQASALLMAIVLRGMTRRGDGWLTDAMVHSGVRVDYPGIAGVKVDKHSTGGVGDKTSLILAPLAAACGVYVPMMSGRGLGHTGGTLDKLEAIPGFRVDLSLDEMRAALADVGCAMIGQTAEIAPADKKLYALRDVTGTVESIPLISASIMSKKIAEGHRRAGARRQDRQRRVHEDAEADSRRLAESLVSIGNASGVRTEALITAMDAPLGRAVGNALEVIECIEMLKGRRPARISRQLSVSWRRACWCSARRRATDERRSRSARPRRARLRAPALETFRRIIEQQGGDPAGRRRLPRLPAAPDRHIVAGARAPGTSTALDAELVGRAAVALGAGRATLDDAVDPGVGIEVAGAAWRRRSRAGDAGAR